MSTSTSPSHQDIGNGIRAGHAYSLLELLPSSAWTPYLTMVRNPWGETLALHQ